MLRLFEKPLRSQPPLSISPNLLMDLELAFLQEYFDDPAAYLTCDTAAIQERNIICDALVKNERLFNALQHLNDTLTPLVETMNVADLEPIQIVHSMMSVRLLYDATVSVCKEIGACTDLPPTLTALSGELQEMLSTLYPEDFIQSWDTFASGIERFTSLSFRMHFSNQLMIDTISLSGIYDRKYTKKTLFEQLSGDSERRKVNSLLSLSPSDQTEASKAFSNANHIPDALQQFSMSIQKMLHAQVATVRGQVRSMERRLIMAFNTLIPDLRFVIGCVQYVKRITRDNPSTCYAQIRDMQENILHVQNMVHPLLISRTDVTANTISLGKAHELILLGGINRGGKTTFLRTAGAIQVLFQMGLPLTATHATISPVSGLFSVFSKVENTQLYQGKLGQELSDMHTALSTLDHNSMFLGNEPITATSPTESYYMSKESLCILKAKHVRGIWVSHLFQLFDDVDDLNALDIGSHIDCMHTEPVHSEQPFLISPGKPDPYSGAEEIFHGN